MPLLSYIIIVLFLRRALGLLVIVVLLLIIKTETKGPQIDNYDSNLPLLYNIYC